MPANLFDPADQPAPLGSRRNLTVTTSVAIHAAVVVLVIVLPLMGGVSLPSAMSRIDAFIAPPELPPPPAAAPPPSAQRAPAHNPDAAPITAPETIAPEVELPPSSGVPTAIGGLPIGSGVGIPGGVPNLPVTAISAPPLPEEKKPVRAGGKVQFPKRVSFAEPIYPQLAITSRTEGTVFIEATIDENGSVTNVKILRGHPLLDAAAKEAVSKWRYSPTTLNGERVSVVMTVTVTFKLR